jgi:ubiquinone/menaquinone biosynthesis C-methylase UbiE
MPQPTIGPATHPLAVEVQQSLLYGKFGTGDAMPHLCPWWIGYFLISPLRKLSQNPEKILRPHAKAGMMVLEPGPGMGFFTLELARLVGGAGRVIAVDIQEKMLSKLKKRAQKASLDDRIEMRLAKPESLGIGDLAGKIDFAMAFAMVHELPDAGAFLKEIHSALKPDGRMLISEPAGHVTAEAFEKTVQIAEEAGFALVDRPSINREHSALFQKIV